jgi:uncharacterized protein (TIGR00251 family)
MARGASGGLELRPDGAGSRLRLRVSAGASRSRVAGVHGGALKLSVAAPPEKGKANREVVRLVAKLFDLDARDVLIVAGLTSPDKVVHLPLPPAGAAARWAAREDVPDTIAPRS